MTIIRIFFSNIITKRSFIIKILNTEKNWKLSDIGFHYDHINKWIFFKIILMALVVIITINDH